jgi:hypothetical protein
MLATSSIKSLIAPTCSPTEKDILDKFISLLDTYKVRYTTINGKPFFAVANLCTAKGLNSKDFKNYLVDGKCVLAGTFTKLEGKDLEQFKQCWERDGNPQFFKARSLWVTNWRGTFSLMSAGASEQAKQFQTLGADSVEVITSKVTSLHPPAPYLTVVPTHQSPVGVTEEHIQEAICSLASYTNRHFKREHTLVNTLADGIDNTAKTRRFDLIEKCGRSVKIYEMKRQTLTADHVKETIGDKGYLDLAVSRFPNKTVKLFFVANSLTPAAERLIKQFTKIKFIPLSSLVIELVDEIRQEIRGESKEAEWFLDKRILPQFEKVLPLPKLLSAA